MEPTVTVHRNALVEADAPRHPNLGLRARVARSDHRTRLQHLRPRAHRGWCSPWRPSHGEVRGATLERHHPGRRRLRGSERHLHQRPLPPLQRPSARVCKDARPKAGLDWRQRDHPGGAVAKIYLQKGRKALWMSLARRWPGRLHHYLLLLLALLGVFFSRGRRDPALDQRKLLTASALTVALLLFLLQGVLAVPEPRYLYPAQLGVLVPTFLVAEGLVDRLRLAWQRPQPAAPGERPS